MSLVGVRDIIGTTRESVQQNDDVCNLLEIYKELQKEDENNSVVEVTNSIIENCPTLITPVEDYIIPVAVCAVCLLDQCFIPSGNEERVHTVTLRLDADNISLPEKLFQIDFNWV